MPSAKLHCQLNRGAALVDSHVGGRLAVPVQGRASPTPGVSTFSGSAGFQPAATGRKACWKPALPCLVGLQCQQQQKCRNSRGRASPTPTARRGTACRLLAGETPRAARLPMRCIGMRSTLCPMEGCVITRPGRRDAGLSGPFLEQPRREGQRGRQREKAAGLARGRW
jgi:hypothetical protein